MKADYHYYISRPMSVFLHIVGTNRVFLIEQTENE